MPGAVETALILKELQDEGKIAEIGGTNFDTPHVARCSTPACPLVSMQVQYSLLDARPENGLAALCARAGRQAPLLRHRRGRLPVRALARRARAGRAVRQPVACQIQADHRRFRRLGRSSRRFSTAARQSDASTASALPAVATRWVLDRPQVAGAIIGARYAEHLPDNLSTSSPSPSTADDRDAIARRPAQRRPDRWATSTRSSGTGRAGTGAS